MKKLTIACALMLILSTQLINAVTFEKISGKRTFYMPELSAIMEEKAYEVHSFEFDFPFDGSNALKKHILLEVFGNKVGNTSSVNYATDKFLNTFLDEESNDRPQLISYTPEDSWAIQQVNTEGKLISQNSNLIVYEAQSYIYFAGAAHGMYGVSYLNYYIPSNKALKDSDILLTSKKSLITKAIRRNARKVADALYNPNDFSGIVYSETFYISNKGITFVYQPYEIGPYASGVIEIIVPKSQLAGCLTPLGKKLIK